MKKQKVLTTISVLSGTMDSLHRADEKKATKKIAKKILKLVNKLG